jgi:hypothetical protein
VIERLEEDVRDTGPPFEVQHNARATIGARAARRTSCQRARRVLAGAGAGHVDAGGQGGVRRRDVPALEAREEEARQVGAHGLGGLRDISEACVHFHSYKATCLHNAWGACAS